MVVCDDILLHSIMGLLSKIQLNEQISSFKIDK